MGGKAPRARHQLRPHAHGRPAAPGARASRRRDRRHLRPRPRRAWQRAIATFAHPRRPGLHRPRRLPRRSAPTSPSSARRPPSTPRPVEAIAPHGINVMVEKPFAASAADARRDDRGDGRARQAARRQLAARLVPLAQHRQAAGRRGRDRRADRGAFLRRQPRPALPSRRQGRGLARGGRAAEAGVLVVQAGAPAAAACSTISATAPRSAPGSWTARRRSR